MPVRTRSAGALSQSEARALERVLRVLHRELRDFLAALPVDAQTASGLARRLGVERTTCQRAVFSANQAFPGVALVGQLPGRAGLRLLAAAAERLGSATATAAAKALSAAIDEYENTVLRIAGSRSRLLARIQSAEDAHAARARPGGDSLHARLFDAAAELTGRHSQTWLAVHIYEPADRADRLIQTRAHGLIGHVAREDAVPLTFHVFATPTTAGHDAAADGASSAATEPLGHFQPLTPGDSSDGAPAEVLRAFSTTPAPLVRSRQPNEFLVQTVDPNPEEPARPFDVVFGLCGSMEHPGRTAPFLEEVWALINTPARWLLLDVFMRRDLARTCVPGLDMHLWRPDFASQVGERWQTRFGTPPKLQLLAGDPAGLRSDAYARHAELVCYLFEQRGLNPAEYVGYRCETPLPAWRTGYRMFFDFGDGSGG